MLLFLHLTGIHINLFHIYPLLTIEAINRIIMMNFRVIIFEFSLRSLMA